MLTSKDKFLPMSAIDSTKAVYSRPLLGVLVTLVLVGWGSAVAYYQAFSARQPYDDEGFLIGWVRSFLRTSPLRRSPLLLWSRVFLVSDSGPFHSAHGSNHGFRSFDRDFLLGTHLRLGFLLYSRTTVRGHSAQ